MPGPDRGADRARELCRRLKPIIGGQADRIWLAYVAENADGKEQMQDYLELLAAQHFQGTLESQDPGLVPPSRDDAAGEYELGTVSYNGKHLYPFGLREGEWTQHVGVFGRSGAGKTNLGYLLVQRLAHAGKQPLVLDWKRSYRQLLSLPGFEDAAVYTIGRPISPLLFNPLIPPPQTNPQTWLKKIIAVTAHAYLLGDGVMFLLQEAIDRTYQEAGVYDGSVQRWPTFRDVLDVLRKRQTSGREAGWLSSALRALSSLCFGEMDVLLNHGNDDIRHLLTRPVILELDALTQSDKVFFVQAVLLYIHHLRMAEHERQQFRHAIVVEEAHHVLSDERKSLVGGQSVMEITFREIREFGESMIILDQRPSQIAPAALANLYTTICFDITHGSDVSAMGQAMLLQSDERNILGNLQVGEAIVRLQGRSVKPFMLRVPEFNLPKDPVTDAKVMRHMTGLGLLSARRQSIPHAPVPRPMQSDRNAQSSAPTTISPPNHQLLLDVQAYPDSGIAERYKRLGLSVRQGQKLKVRLLQEGMIEEQLQTTHSGKLRVIRLTGQGRLSLEVDEGNVASQPDHAERVQFMRQDGIDASGAASPSADLEETHK